MCTLQTLKLEYMENFGCDFFDAASFTRHKLHEPEAPGIQLWIQFLVKYAVVDFDSRAVTPSSDGSDGGGYSAIGNGKKEDEQKNQHEEEIVLIECIEAFLSCLNIWIVHRWLVCEIIHANQFIVFSLFLRPLFCSCFACMPHRNGITATHSIRVISTRSPYNERTLLRTKAPMAIQCNDLTRDTIVSSAGSNAVDTYLSYMLLDPSNLAL